ncbi:MAG: SRPBCC family protein [Marinibacterium sp.]|nr:SRPBCC family protein [Marinibacterium sp.]
MKFSSEEDIETPIDRVFEQLTNFEMFERTAIRRGVEIERERGIAQPVVGMAWKARFEMRGRSREARVELTHLDRPNTMRFDAIGKGVDGSFFIDLLPLSPRSTRMSVVLDIEPKTLSARLLIQSMKLAKTNLTKRFRKKVWEFAKTL